MNCMGGIVFFILIAMMSKWLKLPFQGDGDKDWLAIGVFSSLYLLLFTLLLGAIYGIVAAAVPQPTQKYFWVVLIPLGKFALYGSSIGLVLSACLGVACNVKASIKMRRIRHEVENQKDCKKNG